MAQSLGAHVAQTQHPYVLRCLDPVRDLWCVVDTRDGARGNTHSRECARSIYMSNRAAYLANGGAQ